MLAIALTLVVAGAPPAARGFLAPHTPEVVQQVESRLTKWLAGGGDLAALTANAAELKAHPVAAGAENTALKEFTATRALIEFVGKVATVHLFDDGGNVCEVVLLAVGTSEAQQRYVVLAAPRTFTRSFDDVGKTLKDRKEMLVYLEKTKGQWDTGTMPKPPPPDCATTLKNALKTIFDAEKKYFAENQKYSGSLSKVGVDVQSLGVTSAKVSVQAQNFTITVGRDPAQMTMNDKGDVLVIVDCPAK
ncbi:MAG: hypothetical protein JNM17_35385 [Archangium sp.]|nr:hypothetical protein [Archangium sp.]